MPTFPVGIKDEVLWDLFKSTVSTKTTTQEVFQEFIRDRVREAYSEETIASIPSFDERHLEYFREHLDNEV